MFTEMKFDYEANYKNQLKEAQEFQDFWCSYLWKHECLAIGNFSSEKYQKKVGENLQGFEFKYDKQFCKTGNLWIETEERKTPKQKYVTSGIYRNDNTWMYCIGDYSTLYIFTKKGLCKLVKLNHLSIIANNNDTSKGYLMSKNLASKYAAKVILLKKG